MEGWPDSIFLGLRSSLAGAALVLLVFSSCSEPELQQGPAAVELVVLGNVQDAGSPHIGCKKKCCARLTADNLPRRLVSSLGLADHRTQKSCLFDASPDLPQQISDLNRICGFPAGKMPDKVFLTHAHIGHYTGLMYFGREGLNARGIPVFCLPRLQSFLKNNGPWSQLCSLENISTTILFPDSAIRLGTGVSVTTFTVPHRDEFSETAGFLVRGPSRSALYIPDIDKWQKWSKDLRAVLSQVDYAFIDGTFYSAAEISNRNIREIPHPFVTETMAILQQVSAEDKNKIWFIHLNHSNPLLDSNSAETDLIVRSGFHIARQGNRFAL